MCDLMPKHTVTKIHIIRPEDDIEIMQPSDLDESVEDPDMEYHICNVVIDSQDHQIWKEMRSRGIGAIMFRDDAYSLSGHKLPGMVAVLNMDTMTPRSDLFKAFDDIKAEISK